VTQKRTFVNLHLPKLPGNGSNRKSILEKKANYWKNVGSRLTDKNLPASGGEWRRQDYCAWSAENRLFPEFLDRELISSLLLVVLLVGVTSSKKNIWRSVLYFTYIGLIGLLKSRPSRVLSWYHIASWYWDWQCQLIGWAVPYLLTCCY